MSDLKEIKLYPRTTTTEAFVRGRMTIRLDRSGNPMTETGIEALDQDVVKAVFTGAQPDGYGTVIHRVIGDKNTSVVRAMLTYTIIASLQRLVLIHAQLKRAFPTRFRRQRCLTGVDFITSYQDDIDPRKTTIYVDFRTDADEMRQIAAPITTSKD